MGPGAPSSPGVPGRPKSPYKDECNILVQDFSHSALTLGPGGPGDPFSPRSPSGP